MRYFVDSEEQILVRRCTDNVCGEKEGPRKDWRVSKKVGAENLDGHDKEDDVFGEGLGAAELRYLRTPLSAAVDANHVGKDAPLDVP